jgi:histidinol dehydrogenase
MRLVKSSKEIPSLDALLQGKKKAAFDPALAALVAEIIRNVAERGDAALMEYAARFEGRTLASPKEFVIGADAIDAAYKRTDEATRLALHHAYARVRSYHDNMVPQELYYTDAGGTELGNLWRRVSSVGLYVPGGTAAYPSSVIMNAAPALAAGVERLVMASPSPSGRPNDAVLAAAYVCGIDAIYNVGGAQGVAALAFGTETVPKADMIVGPGNKYVAEAKRQLFGLVGVDMVAGPSEILVIADDSANPEWAAADMLSQAEHDADAKCYLICYDESFAREVLKHADRLAETLPRREIVRKSREEHEAVLVAESMEEAVDAANRIAPEHLELLVRAPDEYVKLLRHAGAIFAGHYSPEAVGDYIAGPSHVLPTDGTAAFSSGLSVYSFLKRVSYIRNDAASFRAIADDAHLLAKKEGLDAHALSLALRGAGAHDG